VTSINFVVDGVPVGSDLTGKVHPQSTVVANVTVDGGCVVVGLASYSAPNRDFDHNLAQQKLYDFQTAALSTGTHVGALKVTIPPCLFQMDAFTGDVIEHFVPPDTTYGGQHRLLKTAKGGLDCNPTTTTTQPETTTTVPHTTTTVPQTTTTVPHSSATTTSTTSTTVVGGGTTTPPTVLGASETPSNGGDSPSVQPDAAPSTLPRTGSSGPAVLAVIGVSMLAFGLLLRRSAAA
jgi:LPXTG-motif cell wall-anchored protein